MDHDDDVEHLFSWLQTPELRYREFAGAREITDTVITWQRADAAPTPVPPPEDTQLQEEYPPDQFPDQRDAPADIVAEPPPPSAPVATMPPPAVPPAPPLAPPAAVAREHPAEPAGPFTLGAGGRNNLRRPHYEEPVPPSVVQSPAPRQVATPPAPAPPPPPVAAPATPPAPPPSTSGAGRLLGGAYRDNGAHGNGATPSSAAQSQPRNEHSLDAVFSRLAGGRTRPFDPRERLRRIPGVGPPPNRSR